MPRKSTLNGRRPRLPGKVTADVERPLERKQNAAGAPTHNATADFPSQSVSRFKCEAIAMIRSRVPMATLMTLATNRDRLCPTDRPPPAASRPVTAEQHCAGAAYHHLRASPWSLAAPGLAPPETIPRLVTHRRFVQGLSVWRGGEWIWVPAHYK